VTLAAARTIAAARQALTELLRQGGIDSPDADARLLIAEALDIGRTELIINGDRAITPDQVKRIDAFAQRRLAHEPVARILGAKEFWGLPLQLSAATLVPRPDTETVVELALAMSRAAPHLDRRLRIADIGTGSGAILLALLSELPDAYGLGTDISAAALRTAKSNAARLGFATRADFVACDYTAALAGPFDLIVSNPPYVRSAEIIDLATEVREHDPHRALDGGTDGLDAYRALVPEAARLLAFQGALVVEVGHDQSGDIERLMVAAGLTLERPPRADLAGIRRAVAGRKLPP